MDGKNASNPGQTLGKLTSVHERLENQQQARRADHGPEHPGELEDKIERSIEHLKQRRFTIVKFPMSGDDMWLREIDNMISVLERRLAKLGTKTAMIHDDRHDDDDDDDDRTPFKSQSKPYPVPPTHSTKEEELYREGDFQSSNVRAAGLRRGNFDSWSLSSVARMRLNLGLARRGLQMVPEDDDLELEDFIYGTRVEEAPRPRERSSESHRRGSADSGNAEKGSFERIRSTPRQHDEIILANRDKKGKDIVTMKNPIQHDEKRVVFENPKMPSHHKDYFEKTYDRERANQETMHQPRESIEMLKKGGKKAGKRLKYMKVHRKYMSPDTLDEYELPWEWHEVSLALCRVDCLADKVLPG